MRWYGNAKRLLHQRMPKLQQPQWKKQAREEDHIKDGETRMK